MSGKPKSSFDVIDTCLKQIAVAKYLMINNDGVDESEVDNFINETGNKHMTEVMTMSKHEVLMFMINDIIEHEKSRGE